MSPKYQGQVRLVILVVAFVFLGCLALTFAPAIRAHSFAVSLKWQQWIGFSVWIAGFAVLYQQMNHYLPDRDLFLLPIVSFLTGWGLLMIYRLDPAFGFRQTAWLAVVVAGVLITLRVKNLLQLLRRYKYIWLLTGLLLTLLTFFFGVYPGGGGPGLWLGFGNIYLQPSEILKVLLIVYLAAYLSDSLPARFRLMQLLTPTLIIIAAAVLILVAQRDLGTASIFIIIYTIIIYLASGKRRILLFSFLFIIASLIAGYLVFDVIQLRVEAWLNPWVDARGRSYQIVQSLISIANGGLLGRGIGLGSPGVVPVANSDFIYPAIVEEFGLAGGIGIVCLYALFCVRGITISFHAPNQFQRFLAAGLTAYLCSQAILIMGGTIRLLPLTGVTLPFVSYGGTSLVTSFFALLLLLLISNQSEDHPAPIERAKPYVLIGSVLIAGFVAISLLTAWWSVFRSETLLSRGDNPRRAISDLYVYRGTIFDRNNTPLTSASGEPGALTRTLEYPLLSSVIGYSNPNYGQTGIEYFLDDYLRGVEGNMEGNVFASRFLYSQYPPGFDIRLSLDLPLQRIADESLVNFTGSILLLNSDSGEILAMATSPTFDSNQLESEWEAWMGDDSAPLLNRATQALYPPGTTLSGVIFSRYLAENNLSTLIPDEVWSTDPENPHFCALLPESTVTWGKLVSSGCVEPILTLSQAIPLDEVTDLLQQTGITAEPAIPLETSQPVIPQVIASYSDLFTGELNLLVSPLQVAVMAASLSNGGEVPSPEIALSFRNFEESWQLIEQESISKSILNFNAADATTRLTQGNFSGWEISSLAKHKDAKISWYVTGTPSSWQGTPLTLVVALENSTPALAREIGQNLFLAAISSITK